MDQRGSISARIKRSKSMQAALRKVREEARGMPRERAREMLIAEYRKNDVNPMPSDASIEVQLDGLAAGPWERIVLANRILAGSVQPVVGAIRELKQIFEDAPHLKDDPIEFPIDRQAPTIPVHLDQDAQEWLNAKFPPHRRPPSNEILVTLRSAGEDDRSLTVILNNNRFGVLDEMESQPFIKYVQEGIRTKKPVIAEAIRSISNDGKWSLELFRPA